MLFLTTPDLGRWYLLGHRRGGRRRLRVAGAAARRPRSSTCGSSRATSPCSPRMRVSCSRSPSPTGSSTATPSGSRRGAGCSASADRADPAPDVPRRRDRHHRLRAASRGLAEARRRRLGPRRSPARPCCSSGRPARSGSSSRCPSSSASPRACVSLANQNALYHQADPERIGASAGLLRTFTYLGRSSPRPPTARSSAPPSTPPACTSWPASSSACAVLLLDPHPGRPFTPTHRPNRCYGREPMTITDIDPHTALVLSTSSAGSWERPPSRMPRRRSSTAPSGWPTGSGPTACRCPRPRDRSPRRRRRHTRPDRDAAPLGPARRLGPSRRRAHRARGRHRRDQAQLGRLPRDRPRRPATAARRDPDRPRRHRHEHGHRVDRARRPRARVPRHPRHGRDGRPVRRHAPAQRRADLPAAR